MKEKRLKNNTWKVILHWSKDCFVIHNAFKSILKNLKDINRNNQFNGYVIRSHFQLLYIHKVKNLCNQKTSNVVENIGLLQLSYQITTEQNASFIFLSIHCTSIS